MRRKRPYEKWPRGPRYTAGSVTGFKMMPWTGITPAGSKAVPRTIWYVHDAAYGYAIVGVFHDRNSAAQDSHEPGVFRRKLSQTAEQAARHYCRILNRREREALA